MSDMERVSGRAFSDFATEVSDLIHAAVERGIELDAAVCIVAAVIADYARGHYGDEYLPKLAEVVTTRAGMPFPEVTP